MGVQRDVGGNPNFPLILLGPAQRAACWNLYRYSIEVYQNRNSRLRRPGNSHSRDVPSLLAISDASPRLLRPPDALGFGPAPILD